MSMKLSINKFLNKYKKKELFDLEKIYFIFVPAFLGFFSIAKGQDINWDFLNYHLYNPYAFINNRLELDIFPAGLQSYFNPILDLFYYFLYFYSEPKLVAFIIGFVQGINFVFIYKIYKKIFLSYKFSSKFITLISIFSIFSSIFLSELGTCLNDNVTSIFTLASLNLLLYYFNGNEKKFSLLIFSGVLIGISNGLKLTNITV